MTVSRRQYLDRLQGATRINTLRFVNQSRLPETEQTPALQEPAHAHRASPPSWSDTELFLISDLHLGGDGSLGECDFLPELIQFLETLRAHAQSSKRAVELIIAGDLFGFWEVSGVQGTAMLEKIIAEFSDLFEQFRLTGETVSITVTPGNHDHDLACDPGFAPILARYHITLDPSYSITRRCGALTVWIEHGNQHDSFNAFVPWHDPYVHPVGYYIAQKLVRAAALRSNMGRKDWLGDMESVNPSENVPNWVLSNYFYREMNPILRWIALPFLIFSMFTVALLIATALETFSVLPTAFFRDPWLLRTPFLGVALQWFFTINVGVILVLLLAAIPGWILLRDVRKALDRYDLRFSRARRLQKDARYLEAARAVFDEHPEAAIFVYGHTHNPSLTRINDRAVINTGTWLKRLSRLRSRWTLVPDIYYPSFRIGYFRLVPDEEGVVAEYHPIEKRTPRELTLLQRVLTWRKRGGPDDTPIPRRTVIRPPQPTPTRS